jgi:hypothetical protein
MPHMAQWSGEELELSVVVGLLNEMIMGSGRKGYAIHAKRTATAPRAIAIHRKGNLLLGVPAKPLTK